MPTQSPALDDLVGLTVADLQLIAGEYHGTELFGKALTRCATGEQVFRTLARYIQFNAVFAGGVANLSGEIAGRPELFRDRQEQAAVESDRSAAVASYIFRASIDEFCDGGGIRHGTHRMLAQATIRGVSRFFFKDDDSVLKSWKPDEEQLLIDARRGVLAGYGVNQALQSPDILRCMGFHIGSEMLADEEFNELDGILKASWSDLVEFLKSNPQPVGDAVVPAYRWILIHTSVEEDHFEYALTGANLAIRYYAGKESAKETRELICEGFARFCRIQEAFMSGLVDSATAGN